MESSKEFYHVDELLNSYENSSSDAEFDDRNLSSSSNEINDNKENIYQNKFGTNYKAKLPQ